MMRIYADTSVFGGCFDYKFEEWSNKLMEEFKHGLKSVAISDLTLKELEGAPPPVRNLLDRLQKPLQQAIEDLSKSETERSRRNAVLNPTLSHYRQINSGRWHDLKPFGKQNQHQAPERVVNLTK